jgi:hypothetical protein
LEEELDIEDGEVVLVGDEQTRLAELNDHFHRQSLKRLSLIKKIMLVPDILLEDVIDFVKAILAELEESLVFVLMVNVKCGFVDEIADQYLVSQTHRFYILLNNYHSS